MTQGDFVWYELCTTDPAAAAEFHSKVVGWTVKPSGGRVDKMPADIPSIGRFAVVSDPQGATFMLFKGTGEAPPPLPMMQTGSIGWLELHASDWETSWPFYERMFGWTQDTIHDMGPMGSYPLFKSSAMPIGGMMTDRQSSPPPYWLYYFAIDDIDEAVGRVTANGGSVLFGPQEVPGGAWVINAQDPQGGAFALVGLRRVG